MTALRPATRRVRLLGDADLPELRRLVAADPLANVPLAGRLDAASRLRPDLLGGELIGVGEPGQLVAACYLGPTLAPVGDVSCSSALGRFLAARPRSCSSVVGRSDVVAALWPELADGWGPARVVRARQPLLVTDRRAPVFADPDVRPAERADLDGYLPAAVAMFTEELGVPPYRAGTDRAYRGRLAELIDARRVLVRLDEDGRIAFKAELGAISRDACQVQGVWVRPDLRGRGIGTAATAAVIAYALRLAPLVCLYVNDFNRTARRLYARLGMQPAGTLATVLF